ncbi:MAG: hypothetical protein OXG04_13860 [Acidobacteria bacterium]|nr:hypothetical protein [Acidobacteriota bacterium]
MSHDFRTFTIAVAGAALVVSLSVRPVLAQGTPWIAEPGTGTISLTYANQSAKEFWRPVDGSIMKVKGPLGETDASLAQNTMWFAANYAVNDFVALDIQSAFASSFVTGGVGPSGGQESYSGLFDSNVALTFRLVDELISDAPSVAVRVGGILAGAYDTGYINSLGDGGHGVETSLIIGKFGNAAGFSAEVGFRVRGSTDVNTQAVGGGMAAGETVDVPNDMFVNLGLFIPAGSAVTLGVDYRMVNAMSGIDIGGMGFSPSRFPGLEEDAHIVGGRLLANVTDTVNLNVFFGQVVAGKNTAASRVFGAGIGFGFGGGGFDF